MKEYRVEYLKPGINPEKLANKIESLLNKMVEQGWEFRNNSGSAGQWLIFDREK